MDQKDPWSGILAATMFAVRATLHTTLQATPMQLVFGRDAILNVKHITDWEHIRQQKQDRINKNNKRENKNRRNHQYTLGDQILLRARKGSKHELEYEGPYPITQVNDNGTIRFQKGIVNDVVNIRHSTTNKLINESIRFQKIYILKPNRPDHRGECSIPVLRYTSLLAVAPQLVVPNGGHTLYVGLRQSQD
jgi:hypothetical protein